MDLFVCWLVAPILLGAVCVGLSLLVERLAELRLPWTVRPALGLALAIVLAQFGTATATTAPATLWVIAGFGVLGWVLGFRVPEGRPVRAEWAVAGVVFGLLALPFVLHGDPSLAGYIKLDDSGTFMALSSHVFEFGRGVGDLPISSHERTVAVNLGESNYPAGGFVPFALMAKLTGQDVAFVFQPAMAFAVTALALLLFEAARHLLRREALAAAIAVLGCLSSLLLGYYLWGGVKEMIMSALIVLGPVQAAALGRAGWPRFAWVPIGIGIGGLVALLGPGGAAWVLPMLAPALVLFVAKAGLRPALGQVAGVAVLSVVFAIPVLAGEGFNPFQGGLTEETELGNLTGPLNLLHIAGVWPALDFRSDPDLEPFVLGLCVAILVVAALAALACGLLARRERGGEAAVWVGLLAGGAVGAAAILAVGSPWVDGKAMAAISPVLLAGALVGTALLGERTGFRTEAMVIGGVIAAVVVWSAALAYRGIWFAPEDNFRELAEIGEEFDGRGPALTTEVSVYGSRHFLRDLDAEGATDLRYRQVLLTGGRSSESAQYVDLDEIQTDQLDPYRLIVVRRSPFESRPPAFFELATSTEHYEVWERTGSSAGLIEHLPLGNSLDPGATADCAEMARLARRAGPGGRLVAARTALPHTVSFGSALAPPSWTSPEPATFVPDGSGELETELGVPAGEYEVWVGGAIFGRLDVAVDGEEVGSVRAIAENRGGLEPLGRVTLADGVHAFELDYSAGGLLPGAGAESFGIGPLTLAPPREGDPGTVEVSPDEYQRLCEERWDWVEAYGP